jgi:hypothetical protein
MDVGHGSFHPAKLIQQRVLTFSAMRADFFCLYRVTLLDKFFAREFFLKFLS